MLQQHKGSLLPAERQGSGGRDATKTDLTESDCEGRGVSPASWLLSTIPEPPFLQR